MLISCSGFDMIRNSIAQNKLTENCVIFGRITQPSSALLLAVSDTPRQQERPVDGWKFQPLVTVECWFLFLDAYGFSHFPLDVIVFRE